MAGFFEFSRRGVTLVDRCGPLPYDALISFVSGGAGNTLRLWDAATGRPVGRPMTGHREWVSGVAFSPDGSRIATGGARGELRVWPAFPDPASALCAKLANNMSHQQWCDWVSPDIDDIDVCRGLPVPADR